MRLDVSIILDKDMAISSQDGELLFKSIEKHLASNEKVIVDFSNIKMVISAFLNAAIGKLYGDFMEEFIDNNLEVVGLDEDDKELLVEAVIPNAKNFYLKRAMVETTKECGMKDDTVNELSLLGVMVGDAIVLRIVDMCKITLNLPTAVSGLYFKEDKEIVVIKQMSFSTLLARTLFSRDIVENPDKAYESLNAVEIYNILKYVKDKLDTIVLMIHDDDKILDNSVMSIQTTIDAETISVKVVDMRDDLLIPYYDDLCRNLGLISSYDDLCRNLDKNNAFSNAFTYQYGPTNINLYRVEVRDSYISYSGMKNPGFTRVVINTFMKMLEEELNRNVIYMDDQGNGVVESYEFTIPIADIFPNATVSIKKVMILDILKEWTRQAYVLSNNSSYVINPYDLYTISISIPYYTCDRLSIKLSKVKRAELTSVDGLDMYIRAEESLLSTDTLSRLRLIELGD